MAMDAPPSHQFTHSKPKFIFPRHRRSNTPHPTSSQPTTTQTTTSITLISSSSYNRVTPNVFLRFPTTEYHPSLKPWRTKSLSPPKSPRYSLRRTNPLRNLLPSLTSKIIAANVLIFAGQVFNPTITAWGAKTADAIRSRREIYRLFTPIALHGGIAHLAVNCYSLQNIGPAVESAFGGGRFLATYVMSGAAGNVLSAVMSPRPAVGASGSIFGLMGAYYVFLKRNQVFFGKSGERGMDAIRRVLVMNLVMGAMSPMVDNWGHLGGALGGVGMAYVFGPRLFMMSTPYGGKVVVDKPLVRVPGWLRGAGTMRFRWKRSRRSNMLNRG